MSMNAATLQIVSDKAHTAAARWLADNGNQAPEFMNDVCLMYANLAGIDYLDPEYQTFHARFVGHIVNAACGTAGF